jgi:hypothetical protein
MDEALAAGWSGVGRLSLVEAPPVADLISIRAVRALNFADILVPGEGSDAVIAAHGRRDAERWPWIGATPTALADEVAAGRLIAIVSRTFPPGLRDALAARGIAADHLAPAPRT